MITLRIYFFVLVCAVASVRTELLDPLSDEFIDLLNSKQNSWEAGRNFPIDTSLSYIKGLLGALEIGNSNILPTIEHHSVLTENLPETFHPSDKWPNCPSLNEIRDQGACGSCWAFGAVEAMTDRYCIHSNGAKNFHFSAEDLVTCCPYCGDCRGSHDAFLGWTYWNRTGIVSGGNYDSNQGCRPYEIPPCEHSRRLNYPHCGKLVDTPECKKSCLSSYNNDYEKDKRRAKNVYRIESNEEQIKVELFNNGPVEACFSVYTDFINYKQGVYKHTAGEYAGGHCVKLLGWGIKNSVKYWLAANSWNPHWGDKGFFKILRGENHCNIESQIAAGVPEIV